MTTPATHLTWSDEIGKRVRTGDWTDQAVSTVTKIEEALRGSGDTLGVNVGQRETAAQLVDYFMEEAKVLWVVYETWLAGFLDWLRGQGVTEAEIAAEMDRLHTLLAWPDGSPLDTKASWAALGRDAGALGTASGLRAVGRRGRGGGRGAPGRLARPPRPLRRPHGRGPRLRREAVRRSGPGSRATDPSWSRTSRSATWCSTSGSGHTPTHSFRNLYISLEAMRTHLVGPERRGDTDLEEFDDRWELRFDPCGSGGRILRGDPIEGTGSRVLAPYEFGVTQEEHPWAWNEKGVCYYRAHCNLALSTLPAERWGHPVRTVDPPLWRGGGRPADPKAVHLDGVEDARGHPGAGVRAHRAYEAGTSRDPAGAGPMTGRRPRQRPPGPARIAFDTRQRRAMTRPESRRRGP